VPERPLLLLPAHSDAEDRATKTGGGDSPHVPTRGRQGQRLAPRFAALQQALDARRATLRVDAAGITPEEVIVLETVGPVDGFVSAVRSIPGLEWLGEVDEDDIPADDDFFVEDRQGAAQPGRTMRGRLFLVFSNQQGLQQILSLWQAWLGGRALPHGLGRWNQVFALLRDVRTWGVQDRLEETHVLRDWAERVEHQQEIVPCELELWFRSDVRRRTAARERVVHLVGQLGGNVVQETAIEEIAYHAILANLPIAAVSTFLETAGRDAALVQCEQIQFFRASGQMAGIVGDDQREEDPIPGPAAPPDLGAPVVALLDGLPLQNHHRLAGRLVVDDPDGYGTAYPVLERRHGTEMASLILHGDLDAGEAPLARRLYVRPILRPDTRSWLMPRPETASEQLLVLDVIHRAVRRLYEPEGMDPPVAPQICVINLSIGIRDRLFDGALSPLARLLDWLSWKYRVLFMVSAGNHAHSIEVAVAADQIGAMSPGDLQPHVMQAVAADARHRRLLSPAESVNAITVAATHADASTSSLPPNTVDPLAAGLPSIFNAQGMGYRRAIKPDVLLPGGRGVVQSATAAGTPSTLDVYTKLRPPGQRVASPGYAEGDLSYTWHTRGTSNATALGSRVASEIYDVLEELRAEPGGGLIDELPRAVWIKALLAHAASWGSCGDALDQILRTEDNTRQFKEYVTRLIGYGFLDPARAKECTQRRVTAMGGGALQVDQAHVHRFPLPPSLSGVRGWRRLTISLAWLTPVNPLHRAWRRADLWFTPPDASLQVRRQEADWRAVQRGTLQHEVLEGERAAAFVDGDSLEIRVSCRADAGALEEPVPYALATTLEVAEELGIDIYDEIRVRVQAARVQVTAGAGP
jgi:hypothetical protein